MNVDYFDVVVVVVWNSSCFGYCTMKMGLSYCSHYTRNSLSFDFGFVVAGGNCRNSPSLLFSVFDIYFKQYYCTWYWYCKM